VRRQPSRFRLECIRESPEILVAHQNRHLTHRSAPRGEQAPGLLDPASSKICIGRNPQRFLELPEKRGTARPAPNADLAQRKLREQVGFHESNRLNYHGIAVLPQAGLIGWGLHPAFTAEKPAQDFLYDLPGKERVGSFLSLHYRLEKVSLHELFELFEPVAALESNAAP
jgi:hypothetical protein